MLSLMKWSFRGCRLSCIVTVSRNISRYPGRRRFCISTKQTDYVGLDLVEISRETQLNPKSDHPVGKAKKAKLADGCTFEEWLQKEVKMVVACLPPVYGKPVTLTDLQARKVTHLVNCLLTAVVDCNVTSSSAPAIEQVLGDRSICIWIESLFQKSTRDSFTLLRPTEAILKFTNGKSPFWNRLATNLIESLASGTTAKKKYLLKPARQENLLRLLSVCSLFEGSFPFPVQAWERALQESANSDGLSADCLLTVGECLYSRQVQDSCLKAPGNRKPQALFKANVFPTLNFGVPDFSTSEASRFIQLWSLMDFPALGPVSSIESYLEFWPASNTADVLLLFDALCTLPTGVSQDFEIDVNYLATVHASALSTLPAPALVMNGSKILAMFSPELRIGIFKKVFEDKSVVEFTSLIKSVALQEDIIPKDEVLWSSFATLLTAYMESEPRLEPETLVHLAKLFSWLCCDRQEDQTPAVIRWFWSVFHYKLLKSSDVTLSQAVEIYNSAKSVTTAHKLTAVCGCRRNSADHDVYHSVCQAMESIRDSIVSDSLWGVEEKKHSLRQLFPKAISKLLVDVHTCNSSGSVPWLRLVLLQRSIGGNMPEAASHFLTWDWIVHSVHPLDLPGKLDTFYLAYDVLQGLGDYCGQHHTLCQRTLCRMLRLIKDSLSPVHISSIHYVYCLERLCMLSQLASQATNDLAASSPNNLVHMPEIKSELQLMWAKLEHLKRSLPPEPMDYVSILKHGRLPTPMSREVLAHLLVLCGSSSSQPEDFSETVLETIASYTSAMPEEIFLTRANFLRDQWIRPITSAISTLAQAASTHSIEGRRTDLLVALSFACSWLQITFPLSQYFDGGGTANPLPLKCLQASARCKDSPSVLWHFEMQNRINEPQSLRSLAHSANVATILFHDRPVLEQYAMEILSPQLLALIDAFLENLSNKSTYLNLLNDSEGRSMMSDLCLNAVSRLLKVFRLSGLDRYKCGMHFKFLCCEVYYHRTQINYMSPSALEDLLVELCSSSILEPISGKLIPRFVDLRFDVRKLPLTLAYHILLYMRMSKTSLRDYKAGISSLKGIQDFFGDHALACPDQEALVLECVLMMFDDHIEEPMTPFTIVQFVAAWYKHLSASLNGMDGCSTQLRKQGNVQHILHLCERLRHMAIAGPEWKKNPEDTHGEHRHIGSGSIHPWPNEAVMTQLAGHLAPILQGRQQAYVVLDELVHIPYMVALSADMNLLPLSVDQHGSILWPYNVAQCIACLVLSPDQYLQNVATERTIVRCEELALKHRGWKVITVSAADIAGDGSKIRQALVDLIREPAKDCSNMVTRASTQSWGACK